MASEDGILLDLEPYGNWTRLAMALLSDDEMVRTYYARLLLLIEKEWSVVPVSYNSQSRTSKRRGRPSGTAQALQHLSFDDLVREYANQRQAFIDNDESRVPTEKDFADHIQHPTRNLQRHISENLGITFAEIQAMAAKYLSAKNAPP